MEVGSGQLAKLVCKRPNHSTCPNKRLRLFELKLTRIFLNLFPLHIGLLEAMWIGVQYICSYNLKLISYSNCGSSAVEFLIGNEF